MPVHQVVVDVMLKPEILDPQGQAVANAIPTLGSPAPVSVRIGKRVELELEAQDEAAALEQAVPRAALDFSGAAGTPAPEPRAKAGTRRQAKTRREPEAQATAAALPERQAPQLATLVTEAPTRRASSH